jgi:hypothetical protein
MDPATGDAVPPATLKAGGIGMANLQQQRSIFSTVAAAFSFKAYA